MFLKASICENIFYLIHSAAYILFERNEKTACLPL